MADFDTVPDPDDEGVDVELFALFMRSTKAPPHDPVLAARPDAIDGSDIFGQLRCNVCHTREMVTARPGTSINGGALKVANALGNKRIFPFGDFLLHDVGTGDGSCRTAVLPPAIKCARRPSGVSAPGAGSCTTV